jgi:ERCC4-related helicase
VPSNFLSKICVQNDIDIAINVQNISELIDNQSEHPMNHLLKRCQEEEAKKGLDEYLKYLVPDANDDIYFSDEEDDLLAKQDWKDKVQSVLSDDDLKKLNFDF